MKDLFPIQDLVEIVEKASTIEERLGDKFIPESDFQDNNIVALRMEAWLQTAAKGDRDRFLKRLAFDGLDEERVKKALFTAHLKESTPLPEWIGIIEEALKATSALSDLEDSSNVRERFLDSTELLPFEDILAPFVLTARQKLTAVTGAAYNLLSSGAHATLERNLLKRLTAYAADTLYLEFSILRESELPPIARFFEKIFEPEGRSVYLKFVEVMRGSRLAAFFKEYAVLTRLLAVEISLWVEANAEFLLRLVSDRDEIRRVFEEEGSMDEVVQIEASLSDKHSGGRSVIVLTFACGLKVVYKPKSLGMEDIFFKLLTLLNNLEVPLPFKILRIINKSTYGWIEYVDHLPCETREEALRYYTRAGMLLCLVYTLEGTDCHHENIIACGEHPVLIDMETLLQHKVRPGLWVNGTQAQAIAYSQIHDSVLKTGLLPTWLLGKNQRFAYDVSGLGGEGGQEIPYQATRWESVNTDVMAQKPGMLKLMQKANTPFLNGVPLRLEDYAEEVITGFRQMYRLLEEQRETLLAPDSPLQAFARAQVRFIYRDTLVYASILKDLRNPKYMRNGADRSIILELLARGQLSEKNSLSSSTLEYSSVPLFWPILAAEKLAMEQGDIPYFTAQTSRADLEAAPGLIIRDCFLEPSFNRAVTRLRELGSDDLERQTGFIQAALFTHNTRATTGFSQTETKSADEQSPDSRGAGLLLPDDLISCAVSIAEELRKIAIYAPDGSAAWIAPQFLMQAERYQLQPVGYSLYDGTCGIALFLAAVEKTTGGSGFRELSLAALKPLLQALQSQEKNLELVVQMGIGGATGIGSILYALTRTGQLLEEKELVEQARQAARLITKESIENDQSLDIVFGAAGAILGLLAVYGAGGGTAVLEAAKFCGRRLLNSRTLEKTGYAWPTLDNKPLTGFSHGAAGIAYSLLKLYEATGDAELREAAAGAANYERSVFAPEIGNWPDLRGQAAYMTSWCHGAPGIGLARLGGLGVLDGNDIREDIDIALQTTLQYGLKELDHPCCGNMGRAEVLLEGARRLSRPALFDAAAELSAQVVYRAKRTGGYLLIPGLPGGIYMPGFFQGNSGVGYSLLRLACPDQLPCVLLWE